MAGGSAKDELPGRVIGAAMKVHSTPGPGFAEVVHQAAFSLALTPVGRPFEREPRIEVWHRGEPAGPPRMDLLAAGTLIVELKAVQAIAPEREVQVVNDPAAAGLEHALLLDFGTRSLQSRNEIRTPDVS